MDNAATAIKVLPCRTSSAWPPNDTGGSAVVEVVSWLLLGQIESGTEPPTGRQLSTAPAHAVDLVALWAGARSLLLLWIIFVLTCCTQCLRPELLRDMVSIWYALPVVQLVHCAAGNIPGTDAVLLARTLLGSRCWKHAGRVPNDADMVASRVAFTAQSGGSQSHSLACAGRQQYLSRTLGYQQLQLHCED